MGVFDVYSYPAWEDWEPDPDDLVDVPGEDFALVAGVCSWSAALTFEDDD